MFYRDNPQDTPSESKGSWQVQRRRTLIPSLLAQRAISASSTLSSRVFWAAILTAPLLLCAIIFLVVMYSTYTTEIATRLPTDELSLYRGELFATGAITLASLVIGLVGLSRRIVRGIFYGAGIVLFVLLIVIFESFTFTSAQIYASQPHLEITQTGFSPAQMSIFSDDTLQVSNNSKSVQTLSVTSSTNTQGIPAQLRHPGLTLRPGQSVNMNFSSGGTYQLACLTSRGLTLTITVIETSSGGDDDFSQ